MRNAALAAVLLLAAVPGEAQDTPERLAQRQAQALA
jgi:hypothetical protein